MKQQLQEYLAEWGYQTILLNNPQIGFFYKITGENVSGILLLDYPETFLITREQYNHMKWNFYQMFRQKGLRDICIVSLLVTTDYAVAKDMCENDSRCWIMNPIDKKLLIYENQEKNVGDIRIILEQFGVENEKKRGIVSNKRRPYACWLLVAVNCIIFLLCAFTGDLLYNEGAFGLSCIAYDKEYYRFITSMFLHDGISHLVNNMLLLYLAGCIVERGIGSAWFGLIYILSGIGGNLFSMLYEAVGMEFFYSVGASGAVFGIIGALLAMVVYNKGKVEEVTIRGVVFMIACSLYSGFTSPSVNNMAHIGGLVTGFVLCFFLLYGKMISGRIAEK